MDTNDAPAPTETQPITDAGMHEHTSAGGVVYTSAEEADVTDLLAQLEVPAFLQYWYNRYSYDRKYVSDDALLLDTKNTVSVNYLYRNTQILASQLLARDPQVTFRPAEMIGEPPPGLREFSKTAELTVKKLLAEAGLRAKLNAAVPDASGVGWAIFKVTPQEDYRYDPLHQSRRNDELDNLARFDWLRRRFQSGDIHETDAEYQEMRVLEEQVAAYMRTRMEYELQMQPPADIPMIDPMTGGPLLDPILGTPFTQPDPMDPRLARMAALDAGQVPPDMDVPEIARYIGIVIDRILPEDFRFDWQVVDPSELRRQARWMGHRVYMDRNAFGSKFNIPVEDWKKVSIYDSAGRRMTDRYWQSDPMTRTGVGGNLETQKFLNDRCAVWEIWHRERGVVYTLCDGLPYPLRVDKAPATWTEWFPFFFLYFNRVDGRAIPMSDTLLTRNLQDEINAIRTQDRELRNFSLPRILIRRGSMTTDEKTRYENSYGGQVLEMAFADDVRQAMAQPAAVPYDPRISDISPAKMAMQEMSGITAQAMGSAEGDVATTAALADQYMGTQLDFRRFQVESCLREMATCVFELAMEILPEENVKALVGPDAVWPMIRTEMRRFLKVDVRAGSSGKPDLRKRKEFFTVLGPMISQLQMLGTLPPVDAEAILRELFESYEITDDPDEFFLSPQELMERLMQAKAAQMMGMPPPGGAPAPGGAQQTPGQDPGTDGGPPGPGADTMAERGPPSPQQIPNGPMSGPLGPS